MWWVSPTSLCEFDTQHTDAEVSHHRHLQIQKATRDCDVENLNSPWMRPQAHEHEEQITVALADANQLTC